jgi:hypothetical protein
MKKTNPLSPLLVLLAIALTLSACNFSNTNTEEQIALGIAQTQIALTQTALAAQPNPDQPTQAADLATTDALAPTPEPSLTPSPTITLTPTQSVPVVSVSRNTNCRTGPGEPYDIIGSLLENEEAEVVGVSSDGGTWIIQNPDRAGECWLWGYYASVSGPVENLPVYETPPTPTPAFDWSGVWTAYNADASGRLLPYEFFVTVDGQNFTAYMNVGPDNSVDLTGTLSDDARSVSGNFTHEHANGSFKFYALGANQFQGFGNDGFEVFAWCGSRAGAGIPAPCLRE